MKKNPEQERISWKAELNELEQFFDSFNFTSEPVKLNDWTTIIDARKFVEFHLATLKKNDGNRYFLPQLQQLIDLKEIALLHNEKNNII